MSLVVLEKRKFSSTCQE